MKNNFDYAIGDRYGSRTIIGSAPSRHGAKYVTVQCDCGNIDEVRLCALVHGRANMCKKCSNNITGSPSKEPWYSNWNHMIQRCTNKNNDRYYDYGGRGISVCDEWLDSKEFGKWAVSHGYKKGLQIDRIDNDGNYEPSNCRWVTPLENMQNRRNNRYIKINDTIRTMSEWCKIFELEVSVVYSYCRRKKLSYEDAIIYALGKKHLLNEVN